MTIGESHEITSWFKILFIENEGMAFGITLGSKLFLTLFRIVAMGFLAYFLRKLVLSRDYPTPFVALIALILAGGLGNVIDSIFYGQIFSESTPYQVADFVPWGMGYERLLYGHVVDMLYFPLIEGSFPEWFPIWGGESFIFFRPVFNLADAYVSIGVVALLMFYPRTLSHVLDNNQTQETTS